MNTAQRLAVAMLCVGLFAAVVGAYVSAVDGPADVTLDAVAGYPPALTKQWTAWREGEYALAADGDYVWNGGSYGVRRVAADGTSEYFTLLNGMPFNEAYAIVVDALDNRWFGTDVGISRLDGTDRWRHFAAETDPIAPGAVTHLAVNADGVLWAQHGLDGAVSRRAVDGTWTIFDSPTAAAEDSFDQALTTTPESTLWAVVGGELWVGWNVYDGAVWEERRPVALGSAQQLMGAPNGHVWALTGGVLYEWDGLIWTTHIEEIDYFDIAPDGSVWVGGQMRPWAYANEEAHIGILSLDTELNEPEPVGALLATDNGVWVVGSGYLVVPGLDENVHNAPRSATVTGVIADRNGMWQANVGVSAPYSEGTVGKLIDGGTVAREDDEWVRTGSGAWPWCWNVSPGGVLWVNFYYFYRGQLGCTDPWRVTADSRNIFELPADYPTPCVRAIFAESDGRAWFGTASTIYGVDDGGTPADPSDDVWSVLAIPDEATGSGISVAVDAFGRIWYADTSGLYHHENGTWQRRSSKTYLNVTVAPDGTVFARVDDDGDGDPVIVTFDPLGRRTDYTRDVLIRTQADLIRTTVQRNAIWSVAADGAIWWWSGSDLIRLAADGSETVLSEADLGFVPGHAPKYVVNVDRYNHLWFVADGDLWRYALPPDYALAESWWLGDRGAARRVVISTMAFEGYADPVTLRVEGLPPGVTLALDRNPVLPGESVGATLTVDDSVVLGTTPVMLIGDATLGERRAAITLLVAETIRDSFMPWLGHK